jgi:hypothetical protein
MEILIKNRKQEYLTGLFLSLTLHVIGVIIFILLSKDYFEYRSERGNFINIVTSSFNDFPSDGGQTNTFDNIDNSIFESSSVKTNADEINSGKEITSATLSGLEGASEDTTLLSQVYSEPTLNVRLRYPSGWVFLDQNKKDKLDGITFWASMSNFNPPPYIHLEVRDKYLFNPRRFTDSLLINDNMAYFNEPEEIEGQVSQIIYIRTESQEDFSIKLMVEGMENFKSFQPVFFSLIKSFRFGDSFF